MIEQPIPSMKSVVNKSEIVPTESIDSASISIIDGEYKKSDSKSQSSSMNTVLSYNTPFRKKAITSIERTRKLSILLKHQRYLVS